MAGSARGAVSFLTPLGRATAPVPGALAWFPVVGAGIGAILGLAWWGSRHWWAAGVAAAVVVVLDLALTGMLHFDGLTDSADGLLPHLSRERRLEVMEEPRIGAFALGAGAATLLVRWVALAALTPSVLVLMGLWIASRTFMATVAVAVPYARSSGMATAFLGTGRRALRSAQVAAVIGVTGSVVCLVVWRPLGGAVSLLCGVVGAVGVVGLARRRLGGYTGDVLGAAGVVLETVGLLVAAARW